MLSNLKQLLSWFDNGPLSEVVLFTYVFVAVNVFTFLIMLTLFKFLTSFGKRKNDTKA